MKIIKKRSIGIVFLLIMTSLPLFTTFKSSNLYTSSDLPRVNFSTTPNFNHNEKLTFRVRAFGITGGEMTATVRRAWMEGKEVYHAVLIGRTTGLLDKVYRVNDIYESFFDPTTNLPLRAIRNISEGSYRYYDDVTFNQTDNYVISQRNGKVEIPPYTIDMASALYYVRRLDMASLRMDEVISMQTYFGDKMYHFQVAYKGKETINIGSGRYTCHKFIPVVEVGRVFKNPDDMTIWFSDCQNRIPISIKFDIWAGSFRCELVSTENLKFPFTSKIR